MTQAADERTGGSAEQRNETASSIDASTLFDYLEQARRQSEHPGAQAARPPVRLAVRNDRDDGGEPEPEPPPPESVTYTNHRAQQTRGNRGRGNSPEKKNQ